MAITSDDHGDKRCCSSSPEEAGAQRMHQPTGPPDDQTTDADDWQTDFLRFILRGASVQGAAQQLQLDPVEVLERLESDEAFQAAFERAQRVLSYNVQMALYQKAMKGSVQAQIVWLFNRFSDAWSKNPAGGDEDDPFEGMSTAEMTELARQEGVPLPAELDGAVRARG